MPNHEGSTRCSRKLQADLTSLQLASHVEGLEAPTRPKLTVPFGLAMLPTLDGLGS